MKRRGMTTDMIGHHENNGRSDGARSDPPATLPLYASPEEIEAAIYGPISGAR
jgi:hypothetical protein